MSNDLTKKPIRISGKIINKMFKVSHQKNLLIWVRFFYRKICSCMNIVQSCSFVFQTYFLQFFVTISEMISLFCEPLNRNRVILGHSKKAISRYIRHVWIYLTKSVISVCIVL